MNNNHRLRCPIRRVSAGKHLVCRRTTLQCADPTHRRPRHWQSEFAWGSLWEIHGKSMGNPWESRLGQDFSTKFDAYVPDDGLFWWLSPRNSEWWGQSICFQSAKSQHRRYKEWAQPFRGWESPNYLLYLRGLFATAKDIPYFLDQRFGVVDHPCWFFPHEFFPINWVAQCYSLSIDWSSPCKSLRMFGYLLTSRVCVYCIYIHWYTLWSSMF